MGKKRGWMSVDKLDIVVVKRHDDWLAYLDGDTRKWGSGKNIDEAIGNCVRDHVAAVKVRCRYCGKYNCLRVHENRVTCESCERIQEWM